MSLPFSSTVSMCHVLSYEGVETEMTDTRTKSFFSCVCVSFSSAVTEKKGGWSKKERLNDNEQDYLTEKKKELIISVTLSFSC